jgi:hypothetical protein
MERKKYMKRRQIFLSIAGVVLVLLVILFIGVGIPFIRDTFTTPIPGLPTANASASAPSLRDRFTMTAAARQTTAATTPTAAQ